MPLRFDFPEDHLEARAQSECLSGALVDGAIFYRVRFDPAIPFLIRYWDEMPVLHIPVMDIEERGWVIGDMLD
jgi:hypothetical protein